MNVQYIVRRELGKLVGLVEAWESVAALGDSTVLEPAIPFGRADLGVYWNNNDGPNLLIEFGTCLPGKFLFNVGNCLVADWGIVPYHCAYGFVFSVQRDQIPLLRMPPTALALGLKGEG